MRAGFLLSTAVITLSSGAFLTGIARLILDVRFVPEVFNAMPENQPGQVAIVMALFVTLFGGWLRALLSASHDSRRGLVALLIFNLIITFGWGLGTVVAFCPTPCRAVFPLTDIVTWSNVIVGLIATIAVGIRIVSKSRLANERPNQ
jgi:hypothetical protein